MLSRRRKEWTMSSKSIVTVFLSTPDRSRSLADALASDTVETHVASHSEELYQLLNYQRVDIVVIENELPGFLSGIEILTRLYDDLMRPATVLVAEPTFDVEEHARKLGIDAVLPSPTQVSTVLQAVNSLLAASKVAHTSIPLEARKLVHRCGEIRPLPQLLIKLSSYLDVDNVSLNAVAEDIAVDPRVTADLLKLANSAEVGLRCKVTRVFDAVNFLGVRRTVSLILSSALVDAQRALSKHLPDDIQSWYNRRSVLVASTASTFANNLQGVSSDTAHVLGLFQEMGILVLASAYGERYLQTIRRIREIGPLRLEITERQSLKITHADVSAALLQRWNMPASIVSLVLKHHDADKAVGGSATEQGFLNVMQVGESMANLLDVYHPQRIQTLNRLLSNYGPKQTDNCKVALSESVAKAVKAAQLFSMPLPSEVDLQNLVSKVSRDHRVAEGPEEKRPPEDEPRSGGPLTGPDDVRPDPNPHSGEEKPSVLVIEDEPYVVDLIRRYLQSAQIDTFSCVTLREAQKLAPQADVVLCDVHLGDDHGANVIQGLIQNGYTGPIIAISGDCRRATVGQCIEAGVTDYLPKPFNREALLAKLQKYISRPAIPAIPAVATT